MRIHIKTTPNKQKVNFDYQPKLVGTLHKWLGYNNLHDATSLYSFSWLQNGKVNKEGLSFTKGANWFISSFDVAFIKQVIQGIQKDSEIAYGMFAKEIVIQETPIFIKEHQLFKVATPVFIKRKDEKQKQKFFYYDDDKSNAYLTETLQYKLSLAGLEDPTAKVEFDRNYINPKIKKVNYKGVGNKASICPVIVSGKPESIAFAWEVGVGSSTGIGFGALV